MHPSLLSLNSTTRHLYLLVLANNFHRLVSLISYYFLHISHVMGIVPPGIFAFDHHLLSVSSTFYLNLRLLGFRFSGYVAGHRPSLVQTLVSIKNISNEKVLSICAKYCSCWFRGITASRKRKKRTKHCSIYDLA